MHNPFWKSLLFTTSLALLPAWGGEPPAADAREVGSASAPAAGKFLKSTNAIPGQYIVVLKEDRVGADKVPEVAQALARQHGATVTRTYSHALRGFVAQTHEAAARALAARPEVDYVEEDGTVTLSGAGTQSSPPWNLDRIDTVLGGWWNGNNTYSYSTSGAGVHAYIIDSGIMTSHPDFGGRATGDYTAITDDGYGTGDCNGHGTHVAGTVGGTRYGVAKNVRLHSVRVVGCGVATSFSNVIAGVDWVTANHIKPAVVNMSIGSPIYRAQDDAVRRAIAAGIVFVTSAGNDAVDACTVSPAYIPEAITVGATADNDDQAPFSNHGPCVDLFAPGMFIDSAALDGTKMMRSGTSMAAPHVSGAVAMYLESNPSASPATVQTALVRNAPDGKVLNGSPNTTTRMLLTTPLTTCGKLGSGEALIPGRTLYSCAGNVRVTHQTDGNVVIYDRLGALWHTQSWNTTSSTLVMQADGHLVLYSGTGGALWGTGTWGNPGAYLRMQDDCNLVVYSASGVQLWQTGTTCR